MTRPLLLDLFCGAGGAAVGYHRAGFDVIGVDVKPQPNYPFEFIQGDALDIECWPERFDAIHASPPCQAYSQQSQFRDRHPDLLEPTRELLDSLHLTLWDHDGDEIPYVIENVEGARKLMVDPVRLCGSAFGLDLRRHRYFEANWPIEGKPCDHAWQTPRFRSLRIDYHRAGKLATVVGVHGHLNYPGEFPIRCKAMGIDWMTNAELVESIPPKYTEYIGAQLLQQTGDW